MQSGTDFTQLAIWRPNRPRSTPIFCNYFQPKSENLKLNILVSIDLLPMVSQSPLYWRIGTGPGPIFCNLFVTDIAKIATRYFDRNRSFTDEVPAPQTDKLAPGQPRTNLYAQVYVLDTITLQFFIKNFHKIHGCF